VTSFCAQSPRSVVMIRPHHFSPNADTAEDNAFQSDDASRSAAAIAAAAYAEVTAAAQRLEAAGVTVHLFEDETTTSPDSVFPNNWFSTHAGGHVAIYPMFAPSRRRERRADVIELLKRHYRVQDVIDYSGLEHDGVYLEGTGAMVLDHAERVAYAARSNRCNEVALERFCTHFNFEPIVFDAFDAGGRPIYHTNVLMCVGGRICLIGLEAIRNRARRDDIRERLESGGRTIVELSHRQIADFAGNAIELRGEDGRILAISSRGWCALSDAQRRLVEKCCRPLPLDVPTIELAGGSIRCMLAGLHLSPRSRPADGDGAIC
jgi:hypothetical protein